MAENIHYARTWLPEWAAGQGMCVEHMGPDRLRLYDAVRDVAVTLVQADVLEYAASRPLPGGLLIAHAFLDLLPMPGSLPMLLSLTNDLAWLTLNFDGVSSLEPVFDPGLDEHIERLYHATMDTRPSGGDSRSGRHLLQHLRAAGADVLAAGASDWVVYPRHGGYGPGEADFLRYILGFFEQALTGHPESDPAGFARWLEARRRQVEQGELAYVAHQLDLLARVGASSGIIG
jgi:hypothetical protein